LCPSRIIVADDNPRVLHGILPILETEFEVVATASNGRELVDQAERLSPDLVLTDISMSVLDGLTAARRILSAAPDIKVVFLTVHSNPDLVDEAWSMGASGYVLKTSADEDLLEAVREALAGRRFSSPALGLSER
jgi:DNA-binding NarL/FixJ family response regulator